MTAVLDPFMPGPLVRERFETTIAAPAELVMDVAARFDLRSVPLARLLFWLRERIMGAPIGPELEPRGMLEELRAIGWQLLVDRPGELVICGSACRPWLATPGFTPVPAERFVEYAEPDRVKIAWSFEAEPLSPERTRFGHETRVVATDVEGRAHFLRYWRWARFGIVLLRLILLPAIRRTAERRWREQLHPR